MNYRLLNEVEEIKEGDERYEDYNWRQIKKHEIGTYVLIDDLPIRRRDDTKAETLAEVEKIIKERIDKNKDKYGYPMTEVHSILSAISKLKEGGRR